MNKLFKKITVFLMLVAVIESAIIELTSTKIYAKNVKKKKKYKVQ